MRSAIDRVTLPHRQLAPLHAIARRVGFALGLMVFVALVVVLGGDGYVDVTGETIGFRDALYYASVTVTTTGYGDITAISDGARMATILLITPARILFLILVVGTTVEVLTDQSRRLIKARRWRQRVNNHVVICGFGSTGHSAAAELLSRGVPAEEIVAVDRDAAALAAAAKLGIVAIEGDATQNDILQQAAIDRARAVVVTPNRDDTAVLITLTVRELNEAAHIVTGGREKQNLHLLRQGGADEVIDATASVGRMLALATVAPSAVGVLDDIIDAGTGLELAEVAPDTSGPAPAVPEGTTLLAVVRNDVRLPAHRGLDPNDVRDGDRLIVLRPSYDVGQQPF